MARDFDGSIRLYNSEPIEAAAAGGAAWTTPLDTNKKNNFIEFDDAAASRECWDCIPMVPFVLGSTGRYLEPGEAIRLDGAPYSLKRLTKTLAREQSTSDEVERLRTNMQHTNHALNAVREERNKARAERDEAKSWYIAERDMHNATKACLNTIRAEREALKGEVSALQELCGRKRNMSIVLDPKDSAIKSDRGMLDAMKCEATLLRNALAEMLARMDRFEVDLASRG
jgi:chromosome segregation ATPase